MHPLFVDIEQDLAAAADDAAMLDQARERASRALAQDADPVVEVPGRRPAVLSPTTYRQLDALRGFRHRHRNSSVNDLDPSRVLTVAANVGPALAAVMQDIELLSRRWGTPEAELTPLP